MKIKKSYGTHILKFEEEAGDNSKFFVIDSKYDQVSYNASEYVKNGGTRYLAIPPSIKTIGEKAFANWHHLEKIYNASGVVEYSKRCFYNCTHLALFESGTETKTILDEAFYGCRSLKAVYIGKGVTLIGKGAFARISPSAIIYCEHQSQPVLFDKEWTDLPSKNIIWGYKTKSKPSTSSSSKVEAKPKPKITTKVLPSSTSKATPSASSKTNSTTPKTTSGVSFKYCCSCKKSFPDWYKYCPVCCEELITEAKYKAELEKAQMKQIQQNRDQKENDLLLNNSKKMYELLNKYDESINIYAAIDAVFRLYKWGCNHSLRYALEQCHNGNNYYYDSMYFNREELFKLYDVLIGHASFKPSDAMDAVNKGIADIKEKFSKLNSLLKECTNIKNSESINYGKLTSGWLDGGYFEITAGTNQRIEERNSGEDDFFGDTIYHVYKHISYSIEKYYAPKSITSRINNELRGTSNDYGIKYIMIMYEILLIQTYLSDEIHQINSYLETRKRATIKYPEPLKMDQLIIFLTQNKIISKSSYRTSTDIIRIR